MKNSIALEPNVLLILKEYKRGGVKFNDILESFIDADLLNERGKQLYHETWEMYYKNNKKKYDARMKKGIK